MDGVSSREGNVRVGRVPHRAIHHDVAEHAQTHLPRGRHRQNHYVHKIPTEQHYILCI